MILMVYAGVFLLAYGMYHLIAHLAYFPSGKSGRSISGFWRAMCLELALYTIQRFSLTGVSSGKLKSLLQLNQEKKDETVWLLEKCIGSFGVFCLCSPLLLVQLKVALLCLGAGLFVVWYELLLYCVKSIGDKRILQRELPFFLLLRWKYSLEERNESDYLAASQIVVAEDIHREKQGDSRKDKITDITNFTIKDAIDMILNEGTEGTPEVWYQAQWERYRASSFKKQRRKCEYKWLLICILSILSISSYFVLSIVLIWCKI